MSIVGKLGREMATRRERMKAQKRRKMPGRKKARAAMSMVSDQRDQGAVYIVLKWGTIYTLTVFDRIASEWCCCGA